MDISHGTLLSAFREADTNITSRNFEMKRAFRSKWRFVGSFEKNGTTYVRDKNDGRSTISGIDPRYVVPGITKAYLSGRDFLKT